MPAIYLPDTNVCICVLRNSNDRLVEKWLSHLPDEYSISSVVAFELWYGALRSSRVTSESEKVKNFLAPHQIIPFDGVIALECARIRNLLERQGFRIGAYDLQIAATASAFNMTVITRNTSEFTRIPGLSVENWES